MNLHQTRMARIYAHELADALSAQLTMHMTGVTANFPAAEIAIENATDALENIVKAMGFTLVPTSLDSVREGSEQAAHVPAVAAAVMAMNWRVKIVTKYDRSSDSSEVVAYEVRDGDKFIAVDVDELDHAHLIAAAPELLEALKAQAAASEFATSLSATTADGHMPVKSAMDQCDQLFARAERLRVAAIAKAEGK